MYVFVVLATHISENTVMTEVRGVFAHMSEAMPYVTALRGEGQLVRVHKHSVYVAPEPTPAASMGGVQTVSAQPGATGQVAGLVQQALNSIGQHDTTRYCDTPEMAEAVGYLSQARALLS
jgi:hypothetical protein